MDNKRFEEEEDEQALSKNSPNLSSQKILDALARSHMRLYIEISWGVTDPMKISTNPKNRGCNCPYLEEVDLVKTRTSGSLDQLRV
jgi:hypothetical protein